MAFMRFAGPNERRVISREDCGFYNALVIGAVYEFSGPVIDISTDQFWYGAVKKCVDKYPTLSAIVRDAHTDKAFFERASAVKLVENLVVVREDDQHVRFENDMDDMKRIEKFLPSVLDRPWPPSIPPWRFVVLPLPTRPKSDIRRCFVAFSYSHALGDGIIAITILKTFTEGIFESVKTNTYTLPTPNSCLPEPFDNAKNLPISWGFLLKPLLAAILPDALADLLRLRATMTTSNADTWTGSSMFLDPKDFRTCLRLFEVPATDVQHVIQTARKHGAKLSATVNQSFVRGLSMLLSAKDVGNFVTGSAVNMRRALGLSNEEVGFFTNVCFETHARDDGWASPWTENAWTVARGLTEKFAECAVTLKDQPVGLLRYVPSIRSWTAGKIGKPRESSCDISNLGAFEGPASQDSTGKRRCKIVQYIFSRPVDAISSPITASIVSVKGGSMIVAVVWQSGALAINESETAFVDRLCDFVKDDLRKLE